jgi:pyruvate,water dikinase
VPDGVVLTTAVLRDALTAAGLDETASVEQVQTMPLPGGLVRALAVVAGRLGGGPFAVRSSGVDEDLPGASYAGQYDSVLGVSAEDLPAAVRRCWASAFTARVATYRAERGLAPEAAMAVLIQPMVPAEAAGVAFSADPVTGNRDTALVSAVRGLGDRLADGQASPDEWEVCADTAICRAAPEEAIGADTARAVAGLARRVEGYFGVPQDIEWALADDELVLLQARPITALPDSAPAAAPVPVPVPIDVPPGFGNGKRRIRRSRGRR